MSLPFLTIEKRKAALSSDGDRLCDAQSLIIGQRAVVEYYPAVAPWRYIDCQHEVILHLLRGQREHHPTWHLCRFVAGMRWRLGLTWACSAPSPLEVDVAARVWAAADGQAVPV